MKSLLAGGGHWCGLLALGVLSGGSLAAQTVLYTEHHGKVMVVRKMDGDTMYVEANGKLVEASEQHCALKAAEEFLPVFVDVKDVDILRANHAMMGMGDSMVNDFQYKADFVSAVPLRNVYLVLVHDSDRAARNLIRHEVGDLQPGKPHSVNFTVELYRPLGAGEFTLHLYADGGEVFHSKQPARVREAALDRMVARRIQGLTEAEPKPFYGAQPEYPKALRKSKLKGEAVVAFRVAVNGAVRDPVVRSATDPAFGEAALLSIRDWRYLPCVRAGVPQEAEVSQPFLFAPQRR